MIIPDRPLKDVDEILREAQVVGMTHYRVGEEPQRQRQFLLEGVL